MTRAATSIEVSRLASDRQWSDVLAHIPAPQTVFAARVNQATIDYDKLSELIFDGVTTGAYTDILAGMTVFVGSAAGLSDRGIGYARKAATATVLYLGQTSAIGCQDDDYITVIRDFGLWYKPAKLNTDTGLYLIDHDVAYVAQLGTRKSIVNAGGDRVLELTGANVAAVFALTGAATYVTTCPGSTVTNGTTDHPTITITTAGDYLVTIVGTAANATVTTTYRWIYVVDSTTPKNVILTDNSADAMGWSAHVQMYESTAAIRDRAKVVLYARDYYGYKNNPQTITIGGSGLGGNFTLTLGTQTTGAITWSATNATLLYNITNALVALSTYGPANCTVTALNLTAGIGTILVTFGAALGGLDLPLMTSNTAGMTGSSPTVTITETQSGSIGSLVGCENQVTTGWIDGKSIVYDVNSGGVEFDIHPASWWLDQIPNPLEIKITEVSGTPANWLQMGTLTVDAMLWNLLENYTTVLNSMDVILTGDTRTSIEMTAPIGSLWSQLTTVADGYIAAKSTVNQYGQMIFAIDTPLIPIASRSGIPAVVTLTADDFEDITVDAIQHDPEATLFVMAQLANGKTVASIGGGRVAGHYGTVNTYATGLIVATQAQSNVLAGSLFERDNCPYKFSIKNLRGNNRLIEVNNRLGLTLTGSDNLAGLAYSGYIIVRSISRSHDPATGAWSIDIDADAETQAKLLGGYTTGDLPLVIGGLPINVPFPPMPPLDIPPFGGSPFPTPPPVLPPAAACTDASPQTGPYDLNWDRTWINGETATNTAIAWKKCTVRSGTATYPTLIIFQLNTPQTIAYTSFHLYAIDSTAAIVATATLDFSDYWIYGDQIGYNVHATFTEVSPLNVAGFKLVCNAAGVAGPLPLYQGGLNAVDGYSLSADSPTGSPTVTIDRPIYDPTNGHVQLRCIWDGYSKSYGWFKFGGISYDWVSSNDYGTMYAHISWFAVAYDPAVPIGRFYKAISFTKTDLVPGGVATYNDTIITRGPNVQNPKEPGWTTIFQPEAAYNGDAVARRYSSNLVIDFYWGTGDLNYPHAALQNGSLYNVCPAV